MGLGLVTLEKEHRLRSLGNRFRLKTGGGMAGRRKLGVNRDDL